MSGLYRFDPHASRISSCTLMVCWSAGPGGLCFGSSLQRGLAKAHSLSNAGGNPIAGYQIGARGPVLLIPFEVMEVLGSFLQGAGGLSNRWPVASKKARASRLGGEQLGIHLRALPLFGVENQGVNPAETQVRNSNSEDRKVK